VFLVDKVAAGVHCWRRCDIGRFAEETIDLHRLPQVPAELSSSSHPRPHPGCRPLCPRRVTAPPTPSRPAPSTQFSFRST
jgi:hypothetical protein